MIEQLLHVTPVTGGGVSFLGEVPVNALITGDALASTIGLTAGTSQYSNEPWLHFELDGKTLYVAKKSYRYNLSWNQIQAVNAVYGAMIITVGGKQYRVRLLKGATSDPITSVGAHDPEQSRGSEWNRLFYPLVPNPVGVPTHPVSREGIRYGALANYTEAVLNVGSSGGNGRRTWCQESTGSSRIFRGSDGLSYFNPGTSSAVTTAYGWRPVLELIP